MVERSKTQMRDSITRHTRTWRNSEAKNELKRKRSLDKTRKTNFLNLLDMETNGRGASAEEDMRMERRLAKKLKVKSGRLTNAKDDFDMLLEGIPSVLDNFGKDGKVEKNAEDPGICLNSKMTNSMNEDLDDEISSDEGSEESDSRTSDEEPEDVVEVKDCNYGKRNDMKFEDYLETDCPKDNLESSKLFTKLSNSDSAEEGQEDVRRISSNSVASGPPKTVSSEALLDKLRNKGTEKYVAPHLRSHGGNESAEYAEIRKRLRGLLNRISETNVESITGEISVLYRPVGCAMGTQIITEEIVASCSGGPRGNEKYCLWDHFKQLESMPLIRSMHLAKITAKMVESFSLSLAVLKAVELGDPIHMTSKRIMHFRMLFEAIFEFSDKKVWNIFTRFAVTPEYESLRSGIGFFISKYVSSNEKSMASKFKIAKKALSNVEGILL